jgi:hypothetical protein
MLRADTLCGERIIVNGESPWREGPSWSAEPADYSTIFGGAPIVPSALGAPVRRRRSAAWRTAMVAAILGALGVAAVAVGLPARHGGSVHDVAPASGAAVSKPSKVAPVAPGAVSQGGVGIGDGASGGVGDAPPEPEPGPSSDVDLAAAVGPAGFTVGDVAVGSDGAVYVSSTSGSLIVARIDPSGVLTVVAGTGAEGSILPGPATHSPFRSIDDIAVDAAGNLYIADAVSALVAAVTPDGMLSIVAGNGSYGVPAAGAAVASPLFSPEYLAMGPDGSLYIADNSIFVEHSDRRSELDIASAHILKVSDGTLSIIAGNGTDSAMTPGPAVKSALDRVGGIAVGQDGTVHIATYAWWSEIDGAMTTTNTGYGQLLTLDSGGNLAVFLDDTGGMGTPTSVAVDGFGTMYFSDENGIWQLGNDRVPASVSITSADIAARPDGTLFLALSAFGIGMVEVAVPTGGSWDATVIAHA